MPTNDFLPFAIDPAANVITQGAWDALAARDTGFVAGVAQSAQLNKAWRQSSIMAAVIGQFINDYGALGALDDGNVANLVRDFARSIQGGTFSYVVATGTANAWVLTPTPALAVYAAGRVLWVKAPATNTSTTVNANISGLGDRRIKKADGTDPAVGDLVGGVWYPTIDDGTNICVVKTLPSDIAAQKALINLQSVTNTTRTTVSGSGAGVFVTALSGSFQKKSATSNLVLWLTHPVYYKTSGPTQLRLAVGGMNVSGVLALSISSQANGQTALNAIVPGLAAGAVSWAIAYARSDESAWSATANPTSADVSYLPASTTTTLLCGEVEP